MHIKYLYSAQSGTVNVVVLWLVDFLNEIKAFFVKTEAECSLLNTRATTKGLVDGTAQRVPVTAYGRVDIDRIPMVKSFENSPGSLLPFLRRVVVPPIPGTLSRLQQCTNVHVCNGSNFELILKLFPITIFMHYWTDVIHVHLSYCRVNPTWRSCDVECSGLSPVSVVGRCGVS